jgi:hypothetical protein
MRRSALVTVAVLGGLVCLLGGTVLYSALQDTARTGTNSIDSAALAASADIQLATAGRSGNTITCDAFFENLASGVINVTDFSPGSSGQRFFCLKNVGSQQVTLSALADELADIDFACTGDEATNGDASCGTDQAGELSNVLIVQYSTLDCATASPILNTGQQPTLKANGTTPYGLGTLAVGATVCVNVLFAYPSGTGTTAVQTAQSDRATWRFKFSAQA